MPRVSSGQSSVGLWSSKILAVVIVVIGQCQLCCRSTTIRDTLTWLDLKSRTMTPQPYETPSVDDVTKAFISQMDVWAQDPAQTTISQLQWDTWSWFPGRVITGLLFRLLWQELDRSPEQARSNGSGLFKRLLGVKLGSVVSTLIPSLYPLRARIWRRL